MSSPYLNQVFIIVAMTAKAPYLNNVVVLTQIMIFP